MQEVILKVIRHPFFALPTWILTKGIVKDWSGVETKTYVALAFHANKQRKAFPSRKRIRELTGCSLEDISRAIKKLSSIGVIGVRRRRMASNLYYVPLNPGETRQCFLMLPKRPYQVGGKRPYRTKRTRELLSTTPLSEVVTKTLKKLAQTHHS